MTWRHFFCSLITFKMQNWLFITERKKFLLNCSVLSTKTERIKLLTLFKNYKLTSLQNFEVIVYKLLFWFDFCFILNWQMQNSTSTLTSFRPHLQTVFLFCAYKRISWKENREREIDRDKIMCNLSRWKKGNIQLKMCMRMSMRGRGGE